MVLFLFVVMMLDIPVVKIRQGFWKHFLPVGLVGSVIALEMAWVLLRGFNVPDARPLDAAAASLGNTKMLGVQIYTHYLFPLQVAAVLLLVAIIAAIALTLRRRKDSRYIDPAEQVKAKKEGRVRLVKMTPVRPPAAPAADAPKGQA